MPCVELTQLWLPWLGVRRQTLTPRALSECETPRRVPELPLGVVSAQLPSEAMELRGTVRFFAIDVLPENGREGWRAMRRYREFHALSREISAAVHDAHWSSSFPPKHFLGCEGLKLERRRQGLEEWLCQVIKDSHRLNACIPLLRAFLEAPVLMPNLQSPAANLSSPKLPPRFAVQHSLSEGIADDVSSADPPSLTEMRDKSGDVWSTDMQRQETPESQFTDRMPSSVDGCSTFHYADASQTLFFVDWDDTLFPTTEVFDNWGVSDNYQMWNKVKLPEQYEAQLEQWQSVLYLYLRTACSVSGHCVIVTNARKPWVTKCVERFAPTLVPFFERADAPRIVYAREDWPAHLIDDNADRQAALTEVKFIAMRREATKFYSQYPGQTWKNILSIGDSKYEHHAAQELALRREGSDRENLRLKAIITPVEPSLRDLTYRLRIATLWLAALVKFDGNLDVDMNTPDQLQVIADALDMPELKRVIRPMPLSKEDEASLADDLDEVTVIVQNRIVE